MTLTKILFGFLFMLPSFGWSASCEDNLIDRDAEALSALEKVVLSRPQHELATAEWLFNLKKRVKGEATDLTVHEHTALSYLVRTEYFEKLGDENIKSESLRLLQKSWRDLTGQVPADLNQRLPRRALWRAGREERVFHAASFQNIDGPKVVNKVALGKDFVGEPIDLVTLAFGTAMAFSETGSHILAAAFLGYGTASVIEHLIHRFSGHASKRLQGIMSKMGWFGRAVLEAEYSHSIIHHGNFAKNFAKQFATDEERKAFEVKMRELGPWYESLKKSRYGLSLSTEGKVMGVAVAAPIYALMTWVLGFDAFETLAFVTPSVSFVLASAYFHPYIHMSRSEALAQATRPMRFFLKTRYAEARTREHYVHHRARTGNYNLIFGADFLFGEYRKPNLQQLFRMRQLQLIGSVFDPE